MGAEPAGAAALAGVEAAVQHSLVDRSETVVVLVTGREVKASEHPSDLDRVVVAETVEKIDRTLGADSRSDLVACQLGEPSPRAG